MHSVEVGMGAHHLDVGVCNGVLGLGGPTGWWWALGGPAFCESWCQEDKKMLVWMRGPPLSWVVIDVLWCGVVSQPLGCVSSRG